MTDHAARIRAWVDTDDGAGWVTVLRADLIATADHIDALTAFIERWTAEASDFYVKGWADAMNQENVPEDGAA